MSESERDEPREDEGVPPAPGAREAQERREAALAGATDAPSLGSQPMAGEDDLPRQPAPPLDPYTPEPGPRPGEQRAFRAMWLAVAVVVVVVAIVVFAALR